MRVCTDCGLSWDGGLGGRLPLGCGWCHREHSCARTRAPVCPAPPSLLSWDCRVIRCRDAAAGAGPERAAGPQGGGVQGAAGAPLPAAGGRAAGRAGPAGGGARQAGAAAGGLPLQPAGAGGARPRAAALRRRLRPGPRAGRGPAGRGERAQGGGGQAAARAGCGGRAGGGAAAAAGARGAGAAPAAGARAQELLLEFESAVQKREHEFRLQADHLRSQGLAHELKAQLLSKELGALKEAGATAAASLQQAERANLELVQRARRGDRELQGLAAVSAARIKDLEGKLHSEQLTRKKEEEAFKRKHEELDRLAKERDTLLASVKKVHGEQLRSLEARVQELQAHSEALEAQLRGAEQRQADTVQEKAAAMQKHREDLAALRSGWDAQMAQLSKEVVSRDLEIHALQEEEGKLKAQMGRLQQDIERYQQQLSQAVEREQRLGREKVQLELDWQRRWDDAERSQYHKSEALIQGLTVAKDQVAAQLEETERMLRDREALLKALTLERDQAVHSLRTRGLLPGEEAQTLQRHHEEAVSKGFPSSEIQRLQEQNTSLRSAVAQMRKEMEALSDPGLPSVRLGGETPDARQPGLNGAADTGTPDYVLALEAEIRNLKHKFKTLEGQLEDVLAPPQMSSSQTALHPNVPARAEPFGPASRGDGAATTLAIRKLGDRVTLLNVLVTQLRQKVLQEPLDVDAVRRQLPRAVEQVHLEASELRTQVAELDKHLRAAGEEGEAASRGQQPRAPEALGREGPTDGEPVARGDVPVSRGPGTQHPQGPPAHQLQRKLREAARTIVSLRQEKEQLLEMGNRLRAELGRTQGIAGKPPAARSPSATPGVPSTQRQCRISTVTCRLTHQKENRSPESPRAQECHEGRSPSCASSSLQDTWKLLELGSSPSGLTSQDNSGSELPASAAAHGHRDAHQSCTGTQGAFAIEGVKVGAPARARPSRPSRALPARQQSAPRPPRVRNYNVKA
ncbi:coiled-coil domain-containing protein 57 isoform X3 [Choloepus didactylus]|uniref:coiled-coil domain-containing protein 57 isoform X3 n=1 Tax=Choloepus didactylus TaxID=27675 RepID=UPI00189F66A7|nr:coiled-coil domain-containing protein 57 isoform X3 [Choloepus didactylus]